MYLKALTLKGFKSFAEPTVLEFEPGVTVVVGPNGSGKSNVVDAVAWVLGAQGARVVRSAKMDDVIFAGTSKRAALGRAEVSLTIDNSSRRLPIDFNEVTITRTLFRTGESEYQINGSICRLLDIQELLSDSGIGRQQHVIISQGQLDAILTARPEERRLVIEEAAGVLKYRRRRERAERRLEASETALSRLQDLLREVKRQLKPLERQASSALRHEEIASEADGLRLYLAGQELKDLSERLETLQAEAETLGAETQGQGAQLALLDANLRTLQDEFDATRGADLTSVISRFIQLTERSRGLVSFIAERRRARAELVAVIDDADSLVAMEEDLHAVIADLESTESAAVVLAPEWEELASAEQAHAEAESDHVDHFGLTDAAEVNVELAAVRSELSNLRDELAHHRERHGRSAERRGHLESRIEEVSVEREMITDAIEEAQRKTPDVDAEFAAAQSADTNGAAQLVDDEAAQKLCAETSYAAAARAEALEEALDELRARAGVERLSGHEGVIGTLFDVVSVDDDVAKAFEVALEGLFDSVLVEGPERARAALSHLRESGDGGAVIALRNVRSSTAAGGDLSIPEGTELLRSRVRGSTPGVDDVLDALVGDVLVVTGGIDEAIDHALRLPSRTIVTTDGDRFSPRGWRVGGAGKGATRAALDEAQARLAVARQQLDEATAKTAETKTLRDEARKRLSIAQRESEALADVIRRNIASLATMDRRLDELSAELVKIGQETETLSVSIDDAEVRAKDAADRLSVLEDEEHAKSEHRAEALTARRSLEERARSLGALRRDLEVRAAGLEERRSMLVGRKASIEEQIAGREADRARAEVRRSAHATEDLALGRLGASTERLANRLEDELGRLSTEQQRRQEESRLRLERLSTVRRERDALERAVSTLRERRQRCEVDATEVRVRHEAAIERLQRELEVEPEAALGAELPEMAEGAEPVARLRDLERELRQLGPVNPLAREELTELTERNEFLENQLEDVRTARRELNQVIHAVDAEIVDVFANAYEDVARHFTDLIGTLFPGGSGRLELTAPDDLLNTGVEIEARPAGRNVRRLSLLSGGERSLVACAFLFAVFRSRPSPFYILDEVEAALDEVNLLRFLDLVEEFRDEAQLIIVSHQKKTMQVADALYGISMQPGGASKAVSELLDRSKAEARATRDVAEFLSLGETATGTADAEDADEESSQDAAENEEATVADGIEVSDEASAGVASNGDEAVAVDALIESTPAFAEEEFENESGDEVALADEDDDEDDREESSFGEEFATQMSEASGETSGDVG